MSARCDLVDAAAPALAQLRTRVRSNLPPEAVARVDAHTTQAQRLFEEVFDGLPLWALLGSTDLWARYQDVADAFGVDRSAITHQVENALDRGDLRTSDTRSSVRDSDLQPSIVSDTQGRLTDSPRGVGMLNLRAIRRLAQLCNGERGVRFRDGLERAIEFAHEAELAIAELLLAEAERPAPVAVEVGVQVEALRALTALATAGKPIPAGLRELAYGAAARQVRRSPSPSGSPAQLALPGPVVEPYEPDFGPEFTVSQTQAATALGCTIPALRKRLERTGMWDDTEWVRHGTAHVKVGPNRLREETRRKLRTGFAEELRRREEAAAPRGEA